MALFFHRSHWICLCEVSESELRYTFPLFNVSNIIETLHFFVESSKARYLELEMKWLLFHFPNGSRSLESCSVQFKRTTILCKAYLNFSFLRICPHHLLSNLSKSQLQRPLNYRHCFFLNLLKLLFVKAPPSLSGRLITECFVAGSPIPQFMHLYRVL